MSDFHKKKEEARANKKLVFSVQSLDEWKKAQRNQIYREVTEEANRRIEEANARNRKRMEDMVKQLGSEAVDQAFLLMIGIPIRVMKLKYGWGRRKRLPEMASFIEEYYREFEDGDMSIEDYQKLVWEETGIGFTMRDEEETVEQATERFDSWVKSK